MFLTRARDPGRFVAVLRVNCSTRYICLLQLMS